MPVFRPDTSRWWTYLNVDAMAYHGALKALATAEKAAKPIEVARRRCDQLSAKFEHANKRNAGRAESYAVQLEGAEYELGKRYGRLLLACLTAHTLAALCLESHINSQAKQRLSEPQFKAFERLSLHDKWLKLPGLVGVPAFAKGAEPMPSVARLIRHRNALVHYKERREDWAPAGIPSFMNDLGLTQDVAADSIDTVKKAVTTLASRFGSSPPGWLSTKRANYFRLVIEQ